MSVFLECDVTAAGRDVSDLEGLPEFKEHKACFWTAEELRALGEEITRDDAEIFPGHALVKGEKDKRSGGSKTKLANKATWLN